MTEIINDDYVWTEDSLLEDNKAGAVETVETVEGIVEQVEVIKVMKQLEKDNKLNETLETLETVNEAPEQNKVENKQDNEQKVVKHRRTQGKKPKGEKGRMLRELKGIWSNKDNKGSDVVASASLYAELMGWRIKTTNETTKQENIQVTFTKDAPKSIAKPPSNKMIANAPTNKTNPPATTANDSNVSSKVVG
jgi:hypothetical protein